MQIVIDIDKKYRELIINPSRELGFFAIQSIRKSIKNGTPLDEIRAEITNIRLTETDGHNNNWYREPQAIINDVLQIIDKYRAESEDKE